MASKSLTPSPQVIYLPTPTTATFQSFAAPISSLHDSHVTAPWVGPNAWVAAVQPVPSGGIPSHLPAIEARLTFKDGGAYEFHDRFCRVKERLAQVLEARQLSGAAVGRGAGMAAESVDLEQLPAYEEVGNATPAAPRPAQVPDLMTPQIYAPRPTAAPLAPAPVTAATTTAATAQPPAPNPALAAVQAPPSTITPTPDEPPPGYEEAQRGSVAEDLEQTLRRRTARGRGASDSE